MQRNAWAITLGSWWRPIHKYQEARALSLFFFVFFLMCSCFSCFTGRHLRLLGSSSSSRLLHFHSHSLYSSSCLVAVFLSLLLLLFCFFPFRVAGSFLFRLLRFFFCVLIFQYHGSFFFLFFFFVLGRWRRGVTTSPPLPMYRPWNRLFWFWNNFGLDDGRQLMARRKPMEWKSGRSTRCVRLDCAANDESW